MAAQPKIEQVLDQLDQARCLDQIVARYADVSRMAARDLIERGAVWIDRRRVQQPETQPPPGAHLVIHFPPHGSYSAVTITAADVLHEDRWLLAINKQPGWHANYTPWDMRGTLPYALAAFLRARDGQDLPLHLAHQLDRDTSGVLLVSKDPAINPHLQALFVSGGIEKTYLALASGVFVQNAIEVETGHGRGAHGLFRVYPREEVGRILPFGKQRVRRMHTRFEVIARGADATLLHAFPLTGRTHQIRLHLQHLGHPLIGDARYNGPLAIGGVDVPHHLLHAARLACTHPITRQPLAISAPLPPTWWPVLHALGLHENH